MLPVKNGNQCQVLDDIHSILNNTMQMHTPLQPLSRNRRKLLNKPWITQALYKCIKEKNKIYRSLVKSGFENKVKFAYYKRYRNQLVWGICPLPLPLERRFVLDGAALIRSWRGAVLLCDSQSWSDAELSSRLLLFFIIYLFSTCFVQMCWSSTH